MDDIYKLVQGCTSTFQNCLLTKDPVAEAKLLPDSLQKNLLLFLLQPHSQQFKEVLRNKYQLRGTILESIDKWKVYCKITNAKTPQQIKYLIDKFLKENLLSYSYVKPAQFHSTINEEKSEQHSLPSELKPLKTLQEWATQQIQKNEDIILSLNKRAVMSISQDRLKKLKVSSKQKFLSLPFIKQYQDLFAVQFVKNFNEQMVQNNKNYEIPSYIFYNLSKKQLLLLKDAIPGLINKEEYLRIWFSHSYDEELQQFKKTDLTISQKDAKRKVLQNILKDLQTLKTNKIKSLRRNVIKQLILLDISREEVDKDFFVQYIINNPNPSPFQNQKMRQTKYEAKTKTKVHYQDNVDLCLSSDSIGQNQIIQNCLTMLFKKQDAQNILKQLQQYFQANLLNKIYASIKLSEGGKLQDYQSYFQVSELKQLKEKKQITILESNKKKFKLEDQVILKVRVKNINGIHIQIYKLDLEKQFLQYNSQIDPTQNLTYMQPNYSYHYNVQSTNPYAINTYDIKIEGLPQGRGVWIVQLQGEGISSRAFICKGAIANIIRNNTIGTEIKFYDQSGNQIKDYIIWMDGKKHSVQNQFTIPYGESNNNINLVVIKDGYAEKLNVYVPAESYYLDMAYLYNTESFIVGSIAKVLLHPRLNLSFDRNIDVSLKLLEKVKILVNLTNNLGIKSTISFDNVQFKETEDYILEFPIQSYTKQIQILITGKVKKYNKKEEDLTSGHTININLCQENSNFLELYMRNKKDGYYVYLLGKNGEPIPRTEVIVYIKAFPRINDEIQNLMTSKDGSIKLGLLQDVERIKVKVNLKSGSITRQWSLCNEQAETDILQGTIHILGEQIIFPLIRQQKYQLWKVLTSTGVYLQNYNNKLTFEETKISIKDLPTGTYSLSFQQTDKTVSFNVIKGKVWQNKNKIYDQDKGMLYEIDPNQNKHIGLGDATFKNQEGKTIVQIPVKATYNIEEDVSFRAHLISSNFIVPDFNNKFDINLARGIRQPKYLNFSTKQSQFYNNKKLSQESSYAINRGKQKKYIGNNLEKPKVFLKRLEVRDTAQSQEVLDFGGDYAQANRRSYQHSKDQYISSACPPMYGRGYSYRAQGQSLSLINKFDLTTHNNFLSLPATIVSNKKQTSIRFVLPQGYSHFQCCVFNKFSGVSRNYDFEIEQIKQKSLNHTGIEKTNKDIQWTMSRQVYKVQKSQNIKVGRDSVWSAVGISNILAFAKIKGANLQDWVSNWNDYSQEQKLKVYDEKICHQLNTYIKYNDRTFFDKIILPFIRNKVNKTFVDLSLLENQQAFKWTQINLFQQLNEFQKVLLVHQLVKAGRKQQAQSIVTSMQGINKANRNTFEQFKRQFDTVITAKLTQQILLQPQKITSTNSMLGKPKKKKMSSQQVMFDYMDDMCQMQKQQCQMIQCDGDFMPHSMTQRRDAFNQPFKQMQKTKQYTQTTYSKLKYPHESQSLIKPSPFWTSAAQHFLNGKGDFLTQNFMYLGTAVEFTLACCFIPNQKLLEYNLKNQRENILIEASSSFLVFVKEVKTVPFEKKFGVLINQRFFNPDDRYYYEEDGTRIEKQTDSFIIRRPYCIQTLITNTSGTKLELQLLIDIPQGSIPLKSHQNTQIQSINLQPYSTLSFERYFYFPSIGNFSLYPANACKGGIVIARAEQIKDIKVLEVETIKKLDTLENVLKSGQHEIILQYLQTKNIFDSRIFQPSSIFWMLKDKAFFSKVIQILRARKFYLSEIWIFGYYHNDILTISEYQKTQNLSMNENILSNISIFEYFPYYSSRAHKFLNQNKTTIRNQQFKKTYFCFLFASLFNQPTTPRSRVVFIYYLLLQDRIDEAQNLLSTIQQQAKEQHRLQFDYIECFIDMYKGYPTFAQARKIVQKYTSYPVKTWQRMFKEISDTLKQYDSVEIIQQKKKTEYSTNIINEGSKLRISIPADTRVQINFYEINLQLFFSNFPFTDFRTFCPNIVPNSIKTYDAGASREQNLVRNQTMKDCLVQVYSYTQNLNGKKIESFLWNNPNIKIRIKEDKGFAQVFYEGKRQPGCYCKVYQMKNGQSKFYRDGYTDITGSFKYALADLDGISEFSILFVTAQGGVIEKVKPPSQQAYLL